MIINFFKLTCAALAFGAVSTLAALAVVATGLWLVDAAGMKRGQEAPQIAAARNTGAIR